MSYRAAIIGVGRIGSLLERDPLRSKPHTHAGWYRAHPDIELVAGVDVDAERLARFGRDWEVPAGRLFTDYRRMLDEVRPDLVSVCACRASSSIARCAGRPSCRSTVNDPTASARRHGLESHGSDGASQASRIGTNSR